MANSKLQTPQLMGQTVARNTTVYSTPVDMKGYAGGQAGLLITTTAGSLTVTQQSSMDGTNFYDAINAAGSALKAVAGTVTASRWVAFTPVVSPWIRFKVVEGNVAETAVTLRLVYYAER